MLQDILQYYIQKSDCSSIDFCYTFYLPTDWDYKIREELFQPLFLKAGLIHGNDGQGRLMFMSELDLTFEFIQMQQRINMKHGKRYIICTVDFQSTFSVDLKMISAQYADFAVKTRTFSPQLLKQVHFEIPYNGLKEQRSSLISCLEKRCESTLSSEFIDTMFEIFSQKFKSFDLSVRVERG